MGQPDPGSLDLPLARLPAQVRGDLVQVRDPGGTNRVSLGDQAARYVHWRGPVPPALARLDEVRRSPGLAQAEVLVVQ